MELSKVIALLSRNCSQVSAIVLEWQNLKLVSSREELELLDKTERQQHFNWIADAVTGVSGSGPAYMYLILEAMADEGVRQGLDRQTSYHLAAQTMVGAGRMVINTGSHPGVLKVNSPYFSILSVIMTTFTGWGDFTWRQHCGGHQSIGDGWLERNCDVCRICSGRQVPWHE